MNALGWFKKSILVFTLLSTTAVWADDERQQVDQVEKLQRRIAMLEHRLRVVTDDKAVLEKSHAARIDELYAIIHKMDNTFREKLVEIDDLAAELAELQKELKLANFIVTDAQRQLIAGLKSGTPTIRAWLYQHLAKLGWPQQDEINKLIADLEPTPKQVFDAALKGKEDYEFIETPLEDAIAFWCDLHGIEVRLDPALKLSMENDQREILVNGTLKKTSLKTSLKTFLEPIGLTYRIENFVIIVFQKK